PEALAYYPRKENVELFERQGVLTETELKSRYEIILEKYIKQVHIEALTMLEMIHKDILPAVSSYTGDLSAQAINKKNLGIDCALEKAQIEKLSALSAKLFEAADSLQKAVDHTEESGDFLKEARYYREEVLSRMEAAREIADEMELLVGRTYWPFPTYGELLFGVK
ncbi:MAG: glutamine synthetase type III, partial [Faecalispora jeddahensis]